MQWSWFPLWIHLNLVMKWIYLHRCIQNTSYYHYQIITEVIWGLLVSFCLLFGAIKVNNSAVIIYLILDVIQIILTFAAGILYLVAWSALKVVSLISDSRCVQCSERIQCPLCLPKRSFEIMGIFQQSMGIWSFNWFYRWHFEQRYFWDRVQPRISRWHTIAGWHIWQYIWRYHKRTKWWNSESYWSCWNLCYHFCSMHHSVGLSPNLFFHLHSQLLQANQERKDYFCCLISNMKMKQFFWEWLNQNESTSKQHGNKEIYKFYWLFLFWDLVLFKFCVKNKGIENRTLKIWLQWNWLAIDVLAFYFSLLSMCLSNYFFQ